MARLRSAHGSIYLAKYNAIHVVESSAASVGGAHVEGTLFSERGEVKGKLGRAWKRNRPTTSSRTFGGCTNTEAVFSCTGKRIQHR